MKISKEYKLAILSGVLVATSYIPFPPWAILFCLAPLWSQWSNLTVKKIFWTGWLTQFIFALIGFHWIPHSIVEYGHLPKIVGLLGLVAFAAVTNLYVPLSGVAWFYFKKRFPHSPTRSFFTLALITALFEKLSPQIFPWHFGYAWYFGDWPAYQLADYIGFAGISSLNHIINAWILVICINIRERKFFQQQVTYFVLFFSTINLLGLANAELWKNTDASAKILLVQPNIGNQEKQWELFGSQSKAKTVQRHMDLSLPFLNQETHAKLDFILWPETSIPEFLNREYQNTPSVKKLFQFAKDTNTFIVTGAYTHNVSINKQSNSIFVIGPDGKDHDTYKKTVLLPFGEYIPFGDIFPNHYTYLPMIANFERGRGPHAIQAAGIKLGPQICYEGLHPWFSKGLVNDGSQIMINVTNDSWFGHTFEPYQHLYMTMARAVEFRRPLVRMTNTGISAAVDATGKMLVMSPQQKEWAQIVDVAYFKEPRSTFYSYFVYIDLVLVVLGLIFLIKPILVSRKRD